jgi:hypothetical protein
VSSPSSWVSAIALNTAMVIKLDCYYSVLVCCNCGLGLGSMHADETGGGGSGEPLACAATCAQDTAAALPPLKLAAFNGVVLNPTELLMTVMSLWMLWVHLAASWICWRISLMAGCRSTLPMSAMVDEMYGWTIFHGT